MAGQVMTPQNELQPYITTNPNVQGGVYDQKYIDYLNSLDRKSVDKGDQSGLTTDLATLDNFKSVFGRDPTATEFGMFGPLGGQSGSAISQLKYAQDNSPANLAKKQQDEWTAAAPKYYDQVKSSVSGLLGRDATQEELGHYGSLLASGQADPYQIQQFLMSTPEYQNAQDTKFRSGLNDELQSYDDKFFDRSKQSVAQQFALMGRPTSPALDVALTDLAAQISERRGQYLAGISADQYGGNKAAAASGYQKSLDDLTQKQDANTSALYGDVTGAVGRSQNITDYNTQASDWMKFLQASQHSPGTLDYINTGLNAANTAAKIYAAA